MVGSRGSGAHDQPDRAAPLRPPLLDAIAELVADRTSFRFAAVYPVSFKSVAVNDGSYVSLRTDGTLHTQLSSILHSEGEVCWLLFDRQTKVSLICDVTRANDLLAKNLPLNSSDERP